MLIRFVVTNFLSFNEEVEFNMLPSSFKTHKHHVYSVGKLNVLKAAAIYGANGAGKSNLIKAIEFLQQTVDNGILTKSVNEKKFKLDSKNISLPVKFEIEISINKKTFAYGVDFNENFIQNEWLYETNPTTDDKLIFERTTTKSGKNSVKVSPKYTKTQKQKYLIELLEERLLKKNELLIGKSEELKFKEVNEVRNYILHSIVVIHPGSKFQGLVPKLTTSPIFKDFANELLNTFDTGVSELDVEIIDFDKFFGEDDEDLKKELIEAINNGETVLLNTNIGGVLVTKENKKYIVKKVIAQHLNNDGIKIKFELDEESDGTQRLLDFIPAFEGILNHNITFIIDEIDQSLHPVLLKTLIQKVMSDETTIGQLIFTTHESNLLDLDIFRQDEIWFAEKRKPKGETQLYSLSEFKPRYDLDIRKGYLKGRFGAIPFLAHLEDLNWHSTYEEETGL